MTSDRITLYYAFVDLEKAFDRVVCEGGIEVVRLGRVVDQVVEAVILFFACDVSMQEYRNSNQDCTYDGGSSEVRIGSTKVQCSPLMFVNGD